MPVLEGNVQIAGQYYPTSPPAVQAKTTNGGRTRFNPNIYAGGKVCLSILGTWRGEPGEEWSSAQGLESILLSIQSLMSSNPYENEPGFETANSSEDKKQQAQYVAKIRHETLRLSIIERMEGYLGIHEDGTIDDFPPLETEMRLRDEFDEEPDDSQSAFEPFQDLCKRRFLWYYDSYIQAITQAEREVRENQAFTKMPFEGHTNGMEGKFNYPELRKRMTIIMGALRRETSHWANEGMVQVRKETSLAAYLERQVQHIAEQYKKNDSVTMDIDLEKQNPFVWVLTYFGRPMTQLDGGMFVIKLSISPRFPEEQPRVFFETRLFHHRISKDGMLCYFPRRPEDIKSHVQAIVEAIEDTDPPYDPRTLVHPEASKLHWGTAEEKKQYNRLLRRAVQRSME
ncbi:MAG: hypothetical protein HETSPECPRED_010003 [Heterodermia speciosa]|uniref:Ubiquitin-conjugating enzyme E2 Z n=1 Tax=Heterodermia speciosa TaxID=116794 RepID=A0A8H3G3V1_9LECA|nr:MAG: hypothetical protein HETSPECPRED_010003 [Heterodermia speciosa]